MSRYQLYLNIEGIKYKIRNTEDIIVSNVKLNGSYKLDTKVYPLKGDLITMSLGNATPISGTQDLYRIIKIEGSVAEVVAMYNISKSQKYSSSSQLYENSEIDTALNTTWYETLNDNAKKAIVPKTLVQDSWYYGSTGNPDYSGYYGKDIPGNINYTMSLGNKSFGSEITRNVYALRIQDIIDYITDTSVGDGKIQNYNIWKMLFNTTDISSIKYQIWLMSANASNTNFTFYIDIDYGRFNFSYYYGSLALKPTLTIDLSNIDFEPYTIKVSNVNLSGNYKLQPKIKVSNVSLLGTYDLYKIKVSNVVLKGNYKILPKLEVSNVSLSGTYEQDIYYFVTSDNKKLVTSDNKFFIPAKKLVVSNVSINGKYNLLPKVSVSNVSLTGTYEVDKLYFITSDNKVLVDINNNYIILKED